MLISKDMLSEMLRTSGSTLTDDMSFEVYSAEVEAYILGIIAEILPESTDPTNSSKDDIISEEAFMKDLEDSSPRNRSDIHVTVDLVERAIRNISTT